MKKYKALMFAEDGEYITDYEGNTVNEVWKAADEGGSRWFFYPLRFVVRSGRVTDNTRVVDTPELFSHYKGKTVKTIKSHVPNMFDIMRIG